jgi:hypothetical protein
MADVTGIIFISDGRFAFACSCARMYALARHSGHMLSGFPPGCNSRPQLTQVGIWIIREEQADYNFLCSRILSGRLLFNHRQSEQRVNRNQSAVASDTLKSLDFFFTPALVTSITDAITIALPASTYPSTLSCSTCHPRKIATIGFTYA